MYHSLSHVSIKHQYAELINFFPKRLGRASSKLRYSALCGKSSTRSLAFVASTLLFVFIRVSLEVLLRQSQGKTTQNITEYHCLGIMVNENLNVSGL